LPHLPPPSPSPPALPCRAGVGNSGQNINGSGNAGTWLQGANNLGININGSGNAGNAINGANNQGSGIKYASDPPAPC
jgi:hypothetical protein